MNGGRIYVIDARKLLMRCKFTREFLNYFQKMTQYGAMLLVSVQHYMTCSIYIYDMPRGAVMAPHREEVSKWHPFMSKVFIHLFWVIWDIHFIFVI